MTVSATFTAADLQLLDRVSLQAEELTGDFYQLSGFGPRRYLYEVATARALTEADWSEGAFAQLCRYVAHPPTPGDRQRPGRYYRVCLQDPNILEATARAGSGFDLPTLLLYIMTHELIHIVRFERFQHPFVTDPASRDAEEQRVHGLTYELLAAYDDPRMRRLLDYYRHHRIPRCF